MSNLIEVALILSGVLLAIGLHRPLHRALRRFETRNAERRRQEFHTAMDQYAHYRQTIQLIDEQVEQVSPVTVADERTGGPVVRYLFLGAWYSSLKDAEAARYAAVIEKAREFYVDLDRVFLSPRGRAARMKALESARHQGWPPPHN
jgi:hypothetical protein